MNVISMRKALREGQWPDPEREVIQLNESQIRNLAATVPCINLSDRTGTRYYFPEAKARLTTVFRGGFRNDALEGTLTKDNGGSPYHADGIQRYVFQNGGSETKPAVFNDLREAKALLKYIQNTLWSLRKPYRVYIAGYESVHTKGWPEDSTFRRPKISLDVRDGDYKSYYLSIEPIPTEGMAWENRELNDAVRRGEYDGSIDPEEFEKRIYQRVAAEKARVDRRVEFEGFLRNGPDKRVVKAVEGHNHDIDTCRQFLAMARRLRKHMRQNPGWYRKAQVPTTGHGLKNSQLFAYVENLTKADRARRESLEGWYDIERAART